MNFREGMFLEKYFFLFHFDMTRCIPRREFYIFLFFFLSKQRGETLQAF